MQNETFVEVVRKGEHKRIHGVYIHDPVADTVIDLPVKGFSFEHQVGDLGEVSLLLHGFRVVFSDEED